MKSQPPPSFLPMKKKSKKRFFSFFSKKKKASELDLENCECYVLIKCAKPSLEGNMQVEMTWEGDSVLANYLVDNASHFFAQRNMEDEIHEAF